MMTLKNILLQTYREVLTLGDKYNNFLYRHISDVNLYHPVIPPYKLDVHNSKELFNEDGEKYDIYFMASPEYRVGGKHMIFDYYNWGVNKHIYSGKEMLRTVGTPKIKLGYIGESRSIIPNEYCLIEKHLEFQNEFDAIYTFDDRILNMFSNAKFFPYAARPWYGGGKHPEQIDKCAYEKKDKNISMIASNKRMTRLHRLRRQVAEECRKNKLADTYGSFDGNYLIDYEKAFRRYRFSIVIENDISDYYFTEKLTSCFAAQTVPIYLGARKIGEYFNEDGIIQITERELNHLPKLLRECNETEYMNRLPAILDNFERVKEYDEQQWEWWYRHYGIRYKDI